jgi:sortase B
MLLLFAAYCLIDSKLVYMSADSANYQEYRPEKDNSPSFKELQKINPDVFGWLYVIGTEIDYPIAQGEDNEKYVNTDALGKYSMVGSLFLDYRNDIHFKDFNSIIYGHHMEQDKMFGDIDNFKDKKFFDEHPYANIYFDGKKHGIRLYAYILADAYDESLYRFVSNTDNADKKAYLSYINEHAYNKRKMKVTVKDNIIVLSTCSEDITNGRFVLVGKLVDKPFKEPDRDDRSFGLGLMNSTGFWSLLPLWKWGILFAIVLLMIVYLSSWAIDRYRVPAHKRIPVKEEFKNVFRGFSRRK